MTTKKPDEDVVAEQTKDLANYDEMLAAMAKKATAIEKPTTSNVGTKAGILTLNGDPVGPDNKLSVIVIASTHANLYYEGKYDENNPTNPVCYAYSEDGENMAPHPKSSKPQHTDCATCQWNQWESAATGRGKACKNTRRLALIPADTTVEDLKTAEIATMQLPVTSVKIWAQYVNKLSTLFARPPLGVYTTIGSVPDRDTTFKLTFLNGPLVDVSMIMPLVQKAEAVQELLERVYEPNVELTEEQIAEKAEKDKKSAARGKRF